MGRPNFKNGVRKKRGKIPESTETLRVYEI